MAQQEQRPEGITCISLSGYNPSIRHSRTTDRPSGQAEVRLLPGHLARRVARKT